MPCLDDNLNLLVLPPLTFFVRMFQYEVLHVKSGNLQETWYQWPMTQLCTTHCNDIVDAEHERHEAKEDLQRVHHNLYLMRDEDDNQSEELCQ